ncbi:MAG TPA: DUF1080 domain-containing protein [Tepidisphaeraceae bacterium]|nr:DUF1080 domain-containing protein [Tepidisphaeraceae bacterium]
MKNWFGVLTVLFIVSTVRAQAPTTAPVMPPLSGKLGEPVQLFNGKDLSGWSATALDGSKLEETWSVKDGAIHSQRDKAVNSYIRTDKEFGPNYVLIVEERHLKNGGGGILFGITGPDKIWPKTMQVQGTNGSIGDLVNQGEFKWNVDQSRFKSSATDSRVTKIGPASEKPMGEWDVVELTVDHGNVSVKVNGQIQNVATSMPDLSGKIGFQFETGASMEFRKVELRPILPN